MFALLFVFLSQPQGHLQFKPIKVLSCRSISKSHVGSEMPGTQTCSAGLSICSKD